MKEFSKEEVVELLNEFCKLEIKHKEKFLKQKGLLKEEFEVGKWYKLKENNDCIACYSNSIDKGGYGISNMNEWGINLMMESPELWQLATPKEVSEALIKEAKKRGFKEGVRYISLTSGYEILIDFSNHDDYAKDFYHYDTQLCASYGTVFLKGKWAEIIEEKKKEFTMQEIEDIIGCGVKIVK